jgi:hypothetical protein
MKLTTHLHLMFGSERLHSTIHVQAVVLNGAQTTLMTLMYSSRQDLEICLKEIINIPLEVDSIGF